MPTTLNIRALCFDVIGTVVDWRGTIVRRAASLDRAYSEPRTRHLETLAKDWVHYYADGPFRSQEDLSRKGVELLREYGLADEVMPEEAVDFSFSWAHLEPWPDAIAGLRKLRTMPQAPYLVALTNLSLSVIDDLSRNVGFPWARLSAESVGVKKPDPKVYRWAARQLGLPPGSILMVAAHRFDLAAAQAEGFRTAFVRRGDDRDPGEGERFDLVVDDFDQLAESLELLNR